MLKTTLTCRERIAGNVSNDSLSLAPVALLYYALPYH